KGIWPAKPFALPTAVPQSESTTLPLCDFFRQKIALPQLLLVLHVPWLVGGCTRLCPRATARMRPMFRDLVGAIPFAMRPNRRPLLLVRRHTVSSSQLARRVLGTVGGDIPEQ